MKDQKETILVSACLLGANCRYDGNNGKNEDVLALLDQYHLVPVCPEQLGGMQTPRPPAERRGESVINQSGQDVTAFFVKGAEETLKLAEIYGCKKAVLKERSPSCGRGMIYDGTFSGKKIPGNGVTAALLEENGIEVIGESGIHSLINGADNETGTVRRNS
ncbi:hypothetical protein LAD12857_08010 [Lacrimispora amygdalina]|uniref:DUF523 domain-containing protein n=1 Tax=Lacrimispora amygdalina TaxID=253257 RepID=A0A3E2NAC8_9FIRM|nr:DUF523 domain-containing protein [Clostridium indicum]RFZ77932.1 DUF523 domain-containing protein [Clostridium indicum]